MRDLASMNSCIAYGPDSPTTITPDVLDMVIVKDFVLPVNLTVCSALSSDHFPVTVDTWGRSSFQTG